ncbi:MAG: UPF0179 family protein [Candidatus Bathyarchaeia archaeon]
MSKITIIGKHQARLGYSFLFNKPLTLCLKCKYYKVCMEGLESGRIYVIKKVLKKAIDECKIHFNGGKLIEVEEAKIEANINSKEAILEAIMEFHPIECKNILCKNYSKCSPLGLRNGDKCKVVKVLDKVTCPLGFPLVFVHLQRLSFHTSQ